MTVRVPNHRYFWNGSDAERYRDASIVTALCELFEMTADEAIDFLAAVGRIELARQNATVIGVPCRRIDELARIHGICTNGSRP